MQDLLLYLISKPCCNIQSGYRAFVTEKFQWRVKIEHKSNFRCTGAGGTQTSVLKGRKRGGDSERRRKRNVQKWLEQNDRERGREWMNCPVKLTSWRLSNDFWLNDHFKMEILSLSFQALEPAAFKDALHSLYCILSLHFMTGWLTVPKATTVSLCLECI